MIVMRKRYFSYFDVSSFSFYVALNYDQQGKITNHVRTESL